MSRRVLVLALAIVGACCFSAPALAKHSRVHRRSLVMTRHFYRKALHGKHAAAITTVSSGNPVVTSFSNYSCEVTVGTGSDGNTPTNMRTIDSNEFYFPYTNTDGTAYWSVTSTCGGTLGKGIVRPTSTTSHAVACSQYDPTNQSKTIRGFGLETTYPDGLYTETCNTPNFRPAS